SSPTHQTRVASARWPYDFLSEKSNFAWAGLPSVTVTFWVCVPSFSCHASMVYVPAGTSLIWKDPSSFVTAKYGFLLSTTKAAIQGWTSHLTFTTSSALGKGFSIAADPGGWAWLNKVFVPS